MSIQQIHHTIPQNNLTVLDQDQLVSLFSFFPSQEVAKCCRLSTYFNQVCNDNFLWKSIISYRYGSQFIRLFSSLVNENLLSWKEALRYQSLPLLFSSILECRLSSKYCIESENPQIANYLNGTSPSFFMSKCLLVNNGITYSVSDCSNIKIKNGEEVTILLGTPNILLNHLAHDGKYIYAFRADGRISQWDPSTGEQSVIETAYSKNDPFIVKHKTALPQKICNALFVQNGIILVEYIVGINSFIEVIEMDRNRSRFIEDSGMYYQSHFQGKKFYSCGQDSISVLDLGMCLTTLTSPLSLNDSAFIIDLTIDQNKIFVLSSDSVLYTLDISSGEQLMSVHLGKSKKKQLGDTPLISSPGISGGFKVIGNLLFASVFEMETDSMHVAIFDIQTGEKIDQIEVLGPLNQMCPEALGKCVAAALKQETP